MKKLSSALREWRSLLSKKYVLESSEEIHPYRENINGLKREIFAVLRPSRTLEVQRVVQIANKYKVALYPLSCGRNWGYGSRLPARSGAVLVDLGRMNRIRNERHINVADHYALIEPGVTQGQMQGALHRSGLPLLFNATAAGADTSILGNSLDRGFGYFAMRPEDISGMEVVLGNGEILQTGYGHFGNARATHHYKYGLGPSLDGLFFQSNFGIVTCAAFHLMPRRPCHVALLARLEKEKDFPRFVDALADLRRQGIIESVMHIGSRNRMRITLGPLVYNFLLGQGCTPGQALRERAETMVMRQKFGPWSAVGGLFGTAAQVGEALSEARKRLGHIAHVIALSSEGEGRSRARAKGSLESRAVAEGSKTLRDFSLGIPSNGALVSPLWALGDLPESSSGNLDGSRVGLLFCCPALPMKGKVAAEVIASVHKVFRHFGFEPYMTLNIVNTKTLLLVLNMIFDRNDLKRSRDAHKCVEKLFDIWVKQGIYPYRLGIQSMEQFVDSKDVFWRTVRDLKKTFDPNHIISPGRYNLV